MLFGIAAQLVGRFVTPVSKRHVYWFVVDWTMSRCPNYRDVFWAVLPGLVLLMVTLPAPEMRPLFDTFWKPRMSRLPPARRVGVGIELTGTFRVWFWTLDWMPSK